MNRRDDRSANKHTITHYHNHTPVDFPDQSVRRSVAGAHSESQGKAYT